MTKKIETTKKKKNRKKTSTEQNVLNSRTTAKKNCLQVLPNCLVGLRKTRTTSIQVHQPVHVNVWF